MYATLVYRNDYSVVAAATLYLAGKPRAVVGVRVRSIVIRVAVHEAVVRVRVVAGAKNTTPTRVIHLLKKQVQRYEIFVILTHFAPPISIFSKKNRAAYAALAESEQPLQALTLSLCRSALFLLNELDCASEGKPRAEVGVRVRSTVIRAAVHEAVARARAVAGAKNTTPTQFSVPLSITIVCVHAGICHTLAWYHVTETSVFHSGNFIVVAAVGDTLHGALAAVGHLDMPNCIDRTTCRRNALVLVESIVTRNVQSHVVHPL